MNQNHATSLLADSEQDGPVNDTAAAPNDAPSIGDVKIEVKDLTSLRNNPESKKCDRIRAAAAQKMAKACGNVPPGYEQAVIAFMKQHPLKMSGFIEGYLAGDKQRCMERLREFHDSAMQACHATTNLIKETRLSLSQFPFHIGNTTARPVRGYSSGSDERWAA